MLVKRAALVLPVCVAMFGAAILADTGTAARQAPPVASAAADPVALTTDEEIERFLSTAKVVRVRSAGKGVTDSVRATLSDGRITHDAHIQTIDERIREFRTQRSVEFDFRDSWTFNIAAYKIDRLLGLNMVPVSVPGRYRSKHAAVSWWVDDVMMDEGTRRKKNIEPPEEKTTYWNQQLSMMRLFDQLIENTDRNLGNMLIGSDWRLWAIDHTRAFRRNTTPKSLGVVVRCDREVFQRLKALDAATLKSAVSPHLDGAQINTMLKRRDAIVARLESIGPQALFDRVGPDGPP